MGLALSPGVPLRTRVARTLIATLIVFTALVAVGVTAPADAPFTIAIRPVFVNLGVDIDIKVWNLHLHFAWSALQSAWSTRTDGSLI
jgi:hypothetical protein